MKGKGLRGWGLGVTQTKTHMVIPTHNLAPLAAPQPHLTRILKASLCLAQPRDVVAGDGGVAARAACLAGLQRRSKSGIGLVEAARAQQSLAEPVVGNAGLHGCRREGAQLQLQGLLVQARGLVVVPAPAGGYGGVGDVDCGCVRGGMVGAVGVPGAGGGVVVESLIYGGHGGWMEWGVQLRVVIYVWLCMVMYGYELG